MQYQLPTLLPPYKTYIDNRGSFKVIEKIEIPGTVELYGNGWDGWNFQTNVSVSHPGVLRGLHYQVNFPQGKYVKVLYGKVLDVVVDIRPKSPTFKKVFSFILTENGGEQLFVPRGFAHGFYNFGNSDAVFQYNIDNIYSPENERGILWNSIDFDWNKVLNNSKEPILSEKDKHHPTLNSLSLNELENV